MRLMRSGGSQSFVTKTGCTVRVVPHSGTDPDLRLSELILRMDQPGDGRIAEVTLTRAERRTLGQMLLRED